MQATQKAGIMKKLIAMAVVLVAMFALVGCGSSNEGKEATDEVSPDAVIHPSSLGEAQYKVGTWTILTASTDTVVYDTLSGIIALTYGAPDLSDEDLVKQALGGSPLSVEAVEISGEKEDVEINDVTGYRQAIKVSGIEGEMFVFSSETQKYCLVAAYDNTEAVADGRALVDQVFSSMHFTEEGLVEAPAEGAETQAPDDK